MAHTMGMKQHLKFLNARGVEENKDALQGLRIAGMSASRPEDVQEILDGPSEGFAGTTYFSPWV